jgi:hypothetical protein
MLFACPSSLFDGANGAALSVRTLLASLAAQGSPVVALQATVFDSPAGGAEVLEAGAAHADKRLLRIATQGIEHILVRTASTARTLMTSEEQEVFLRTFRSEIRTRKPDVVVLWGAMLLEMTVAREAREAGIAVVFYLVNEAYREAATFKDVSAIVTDTSATAQLYRERLGLHCHAVGKFIDPAAVVAPQWRPEYITFVNSTFEKGVSVFVALARLALAELPEARFLVVQGRGRWAEALKVLGVTPADLPNVRVLGHQQDMRAVYATTRAVLVPSLTHESGARVIPEALLNGIPVLASRSGGSPELVGQGGTLFELPDEVRADRSRCASTDAVRPWLDELRRLLRDDAYALQMHGQALAEAARFDLQASTRRFLQAVQGNP